MAARISAKQARQLGLFESEAERRAPRAPRERWPYHTRCHTCGEEFVTQASEDRHLDATRHRRYELVLA